jgi:hypothetical protein
MWQFRNGTESGDLDTVWDQVMEEASFLPIAFN